MKIIKIGNRQIGVGHPTYIIAEISANHRQQYKEAIKLIHAAKESGADAIKLQTFTPDTITIQCEKPDFRIGEDTPWGSRTLYDLYTKAHMPWDWQPKLKKIAEELGITLFSTPYDKTAVDFLEEMEVPAYKVASFELVDIPLIEYIASKGKPIIMSTGMATLAEIDEAVRTARTTGASQIVLLKCVSAYPASPEDMNLRTIPHLSESFNIPVGLSDHTLDLTLPAVSVAFGSCIIEKHFTLSRKIESPDRDFSLEPQEFEAMVRAIRITEKSLGKVNYDLSDKESRSKVFRRSLFVVKDIKKGDVFTEENVRSIRPFYGLHTRFLKCVLGRQATHDIKKGTPLSWELISNS